MVKIWEVKEERNIREIFEGEIIFNLYSHLPINIHLCPTYRIFRITKQILNLL